MISQKVTGVYIFRRSFNNETIRCAKGFRVVSIPFDQNKDNTIELKVQL